MPSVAVESSINLDLTHRWLRTFPTSAFVGRASLSRDSDGSTANHEIRQTEGKDLPALTEVEGDVSGYRERLVKFVEGQNVTLNYSERPSRR